MLSTSPVSSLGHLYLYFHLHSHSHLVSKSATDRKHTASLMTIYVCHSFTSAFPTSTPDSSTPPPPKHHSSQPSTMAIHSDGLGVRAEVMVDGQALREYEDPSETSEAHTVTRYIEATTGADFWVKVDAEARLLSRKLSVVMKVDGKKARSVIIHPSKKDSTLEFKKLRQIIDGREFYSDVCFSELSISKYFKNALQVFSNDAAGEGDIADASHAVDIGTIEVKVSYASNYRRALILRPKPANLSTRQAIPEDLERLTKVSETALKGRVRSHITRFLLHLPVTIKLRLTRLYSKYNTKESISNWAYSWTMSKPFVVFQFKYRSRGLHFLRFL